MDTIVIVFVLVEYGSYVSNHLRLFGLFAPRSDCLSFRFLLICISLTLPVYSGGTEQLFDHEWQWQPLSARLDVQPKVSRELSVLSEEVKAIRSLSSRLTLRPLCLWLVAQGISEAQEENTD